MKSITKTQLPQYGEAGFLLFEDHAAKIAGTVEVGRFAGAGIPG